MNAITRRPDSESEHRPLRLRENARGYLVLVHFPGFEPEDLRVEVTLEPWGNELTIRGRRCLSDVAGRAPRSVDDPDEERASGVHNVAFARSASLPADADVDGVTAEVLADVLEVYVPKRLST